MKTKRKIIAEVGGSDHRGVDQTRWYDLALEMDQEGKYVLTINYETCWQGETPIPETTKWSSPEEVVEHLVTYDPTEHVRPYLPPASSPGLAKDTMQKLDRMRQQWTYRVNELLEKAGIAAEPSGAKRNFTIRLPEDWITTIKENDLTGVVREAIGKVVSDAATRFPRPKKFDKR